MMFAAFNHDLGKLGSLDGEQYVYNESEWHRKNQGKLYNINPDIHWMSVTDRTVWLLQQFEIKITEKEFLGIKLSDGMYDESNPQYLKAFSKGGWVKDRTSKGYSLGRPHDLLGRKIK